VAVTLSCDAQGQVHGIWVQVLPGRYELHYQRRPPGGAEPSGWAADSLLEERGETIQNPRLVVDGAGGLHLAMEMLKNSDLQVRYRRYAPGVGWDFGSTEITRPGEGTALRPTPLPGPGGRLTLVWHAFLGTGIEGMERVRTTAGAPVVGVAREPAAGRLRIGPNPLRAGAAFAVWGEALVAPGTELEVVDLAGRRVGRAPAGADGVARFPGGQTARWSSGVYFARARGGAAGGVRFVVLR
jgi:hypothetical protein